MKKYEITAHNTLLHDRIEKYESEHITWLGALRKFKKLSKKFNQITITKNNRLVVRYTDLIPKNLRGE